jgi:hypothetical protein
VVNLHAVSVLSPDLWPSMEGEVGRSGEGEPPWQSLFINAFLERDEQFRATLHFVEDRSALQQ